MNITGKTKVIGIFGDPVEHSLSPIMHNAVIQELGLDYVYVPFRVEPNNIRQAVESLCALNIVGVNVTIPHKETVIPFLDGIDEPAKKIGAINTIINKKGKIVGHNTDWFGFSRVFEDGIDGESVFICGAGGASKAILTSFDLLKKQDRMKNLKKYIYTIRT